MFLGHVFNRELYISIVSGSHTVELLFDSGDVALQSESLDAVQQGFSTVFIFLRHYCTVWCKMLVH